ncbi:NYN domain-containing protein, partial [Patescibacteria group bacterium]|nr:NYN domain-containing protein [Patescibacteria group bacterium]
VDYLENHGKRVEVLAFGKSTSTKLREAADEFIDLGENEDKYLLRKSSRLSLRIPRLGGKEQKNGK